MVKAQNYGEKISDKEIIAQVCLLIPAAIDTTNRLIANTLFCLCSNQDQLIQVQNNHKLILNAIEETLRYEPPIHSTVRMALKDVDLMGVKIPSGSLINVNFASANRDGKYFQDSEKFDIFRKIHLIFRLEVVDINVWEEL
ncbi:MAG: cytochrome P450 [Candidatus Thiodubiliella endoseptemdiera]|uniref:Cytochrome P450 n=1 Tax=Candidatus Thiodubiliella endoseptemdiera TaxID=2738886 RepID=A0A853F167_9GAMM|nr:cytochrome P450 [Candidatus Thiodubiliella endoseptemdiera]